MTSRRDFLNAVGIAGAGMLLSGPAAALQRPAFAGARAGDERTVAGIRLCWCPPGRFVMGSPPTEVGRRPDEGQVPVTIRRGFWMAKFETTQGDWRRVGGGALEKPPTAQFGLGDDVPVYWVNFAGAEAFCARLTAAAKRSGALPDGCEFRLPTEAQWEYACRAGTTSATAFGNQLRPPQANFRSDEPGAVALGHAAAVGSFPANQWGICDMHGNIFEWCRDWYHARLPGGSDPDLHGVRGVANRDGSYSRVRRGGAWNDEAWACRSALRLRYEPERSSDHIGFRVALVAL
jgi:formylglycine-generating enzyme required for sulfatase activity